VRTKVRLDYLIRRSLQSLLLIWLVTIVVFLLLRLTPGDPATIMLGEQARPEQVEALREVMGLNRPLPEQYLLFITRALQGDFGTTIRAQRPALEVVLERLPATVQLTVGALVFALLLGLPIGIVSAVRRGSWIDNLGMVLALLGDDRVAPERIERLKATPAPASYPEVWMLGSSTYGAQVAAALGLPFCYAYHFAMSSDVDTAARLYRTGFKPSPRFPEPHLMISASVIAAETTEEAQFLAGPSRIMALSLRTGRLGPIVSPETAATRELSDLDRAVLDQLPGTQYAGTADEVVAGLDALVERTGAAELILAGTVYDPATRRDSLARIAKAWGL
jgi:hypothetical protein